MNKQDKNQSKRGFPWLFFGLTYAIAWLIWGAAAIFGVAGSPLLILAGAFAPSVVGVALTMLDPDKENRRDFWRRVVDFKRIGPGWYGVILFLFPTILAVSLFLNVLFGGQPVALDAALRTLMDPIQLIIFLVVMLLGGPLNEELGWRGYALDRLQTRFNALVSGIVLGIFWAFFHLPLFFLKGTTQAAMGFGLGFWLFIFDVVMASVLFTWVYNNTCRSTLSAILLHWSHNFCLTLVNQMGGALPLQAASIQMMVSLIVCIVVVSVWGATTMIRKPGKTGNEPVLS